MAFWLGVLTIVGEVFMPQMMAVLAPGFAAIPAKFALAVELSRITFPYLLLICLAALVSGVLNGLDRFTAASASYVLFNVVSIACMLWLTPYVPTAGHALSWGITASGVAQLGLLLWALRRARHGPVAAAPAPDAADPRAAAAHAAGAGRRRRDPAQSGGRRDHRQPAAGRHGVGAVLRRPRAATAAGRDRHRGGHRAAAAAVAPGARAARRRRRATTLNRAIEYALFLTLPAAVALIVSAWPVMWALFGRGAFDAESVRLSSQSLAAYALGLPAFVLVKVLAPGFFARGDTATPVKIGVAAVALNLALNVAFMVPLQHIGPALATSLAADVQRRLAGRGAGAARASAPGCTTAPAERADRGGDGRDGCGTVAGAAGVVLGAAAWDARGSSR